MVKAAPSAPISSSNSIAFPSPFPPAAQGNTPASSLVPLSFPHSEFCDCNTKYIPDLPSFQPKRPASLTWNSAASLSISLLPLLLLQFFPGSQRNFFLSVTHSMVSIEWPSKKQSLSHTRSFSALTTTLHCIRNPNQSTGKKDKGIKIGKKEVKLSLFTDSLIVKVKNY